MEFTRVTKDNLETEHICCAISNNNDIQVASKKNWMKDRFDDGLVFIKSNTRGKCFIEYIPSENAWAPIKAENYIYIDCFWVSGSLKGHGYANQLLDMCIEDGKKSGKDGVCILSSQKKKAFLSDPKYLKYKGFKVVDESLSGIILMALPLIEGASMPLFNDSAKEAKINESGYVLYYTNQCPFNGKYVGLLEETAKNSGIELKTIHIETAEEAQNAPTPFTTYSLFYNGEFITNEILTGKKFLKITESLK